MTLPLVALLLAAACTSPHVSTPSGEVVLLPASSARLAWRAEDHLAEATLDLPTSGADRPTIDTFPLPGDWERTEEVPGAGSVWSHPLPFPMPGHRTQRAPPGIAVRLGDQDLPYRWDADLRPSHARSWTLANGRLFLVSETDPGTLDPPPVISNVAAGTASRRFDLTSSGLAPTDFVWLEATLDAETRPCLFLPGPATATFEVALPEHPILEFGAGLHPSPGAKGEAGDGVAMEVRVDGEVVWRGQRSPGDGFEDVRIPLARHAGRTAALTFASVPGDDARGDLALFAAPTLYEDAGAATRRVVVVGIDTLRPDHLGFFGYERDTSPEMDRIARESFVLSNCRAPAPRTKPSFKTAFTGLYPLPAINGTGYAEVIGASGYSTAGFSANVHLVPRFGFSDGFDYWHYDNGAKADVQVDRVLDWLGDRPGRDALAFVHLMDPHIFYDAPFPHKNRFVEEKAPNLNKSHFNRWDVLALTRRGKLDDADKAWARARYDGEIHFLSSQVGRLVEGLDRLPGQTLIVFHSDHGEEFWEHDGFEHNHTLFDELLRTLLWIRPPHGLAEGPVVIDTPVGLHDLAPTLYDLLQVPRDRWPEVQGTSLLPLLQAGPDAALLAASLEQRPIHASYLMYDEERWAVVAGDTKYVLRTADGVEEVWDLARDPGETRNLVRPRAADLPALRKALAQATGWPVGPGWRLSFSHLKGAEPLTLTFSHPVQAAGVIDPEAATQRRANLEWGEKPSRTPEDVATVTLSADRLVVTITPGPRPKGTVYVLFGDAPPTSCVLASGAETTEVGLDPGDVTVGGRRIAVTRGTVIAPQDSVRDELATQATDADSMSALQALGYVE